MVYYSVITYLEIEFRDADGNLQSRVFPRATSYSFEVSTGLEVREGCNRFMIRDYYQVTRFESCTLRSRMTDDEFEDMRAHVGKLCANKKRIPAIKVVCAHLGYSLKDAKDYIDADWPVVKDTIHINDPNSERTNFDDIPF